MQPLSFDNYKPSALPPVRSGVSLLEIREWGEPEPLCFELPAVPAFDPATLPSSIRPWVLDIAERMQVPDDYPAVAAVAALSAAVGRRVLMQPKSEDSTWVVTPNLWGAIVAEPGAMKSAVLSAVTAPLLAIEAKWRDQDAGVQVEYAAQKEKYDLALQGWRDDYRAAQKAGRDLPERPMDEVAKPPRRRLTCVDATFEALQAILAENPGGVFVPRDEMVGLFAGWERSGREQERSFFLECWNGDTGFAIDRVGRGTVRVESCCVSIFGGIQPEPLRKYLFNSSRDRSSGDGLLQRISLLTWPDERRAWRYVDRPPDRVAYFNAIAVYESLTAMDPLNPLTLRFSTEAQMLFQAWNTDLERKIRSRDLSSALKAHLAKYRKLMPALALLFSLADGHREAVELPYAQQAAAWTEYLEGHAKRLYSSQCSLERRAAITLAVRLSGGWRKEEGWFSLRDAYRNQWEGLTNPAEARAAIHELESMGWVKRLPEPAGKIGRTSEQYAINPLLEERHGNGE